MLMETITKELLGYPGESCWWLVSGKKRQNRKEIIIDLKFCRRKGRHQMVIKIPAEEQGRSQVFLQKKEKNAI